MKHIIGRIADALSPSSKYPGRIISIIDGVMQIATPSGLQEFPFAAPLQVGDSVSIVNNRVIKTISGSNTTLYL